MVRSQSPELTIGGLARDGGVGVETVRFYQRRGLLAIPEPAGKARRYGAADRRRLQFIRRAKAAGFTLEQIGALLALDATEDRAQVRALARRQLETLDRRIAELRTARAALARLSDECGSRDEGPCPIILAFADVDAFQGASPDETG